MDWKTVELMGYAYYSNLGYNIFVPLVTSYGYDFIAEKEGLFIRVNVKLSGLKSKKFKNSWSISMSGGSNKKVIKNNKNNCDIFLTYIPHKLKFIELPGNFFDNVKSRSKLIPKELI